ncbi:MAG TPA: thiamine phosphate synthase [Abditibacteriaceae bacterium]
MVPIDGIKKVHGAAVYQMPCPTTPLPKLMLVTSRKLMRPSFEAALESALRAGARLIQLREPDLAANELRPLAERAQAMCEKYNGILTINNQPEIATQLNTGLHFPAHALGFDRDTRSKLLGFSIHSLDEAQRAGQRGANYLVCGSMYATRSHPGETPAGLELLRRVVRATALPVFAIGGITSDRVEECLEAGAYGVAVISSVWDADNMEEVIGALLNQAWR